MNLFNTKKIGNMLKKGKVTIAVYGLGHVGAPVAAVWLRAGARVIGVDKSESVVRAALSGGSPVDEPSVAPAFRKALREKRFTATTDGAQASRESDFKIITVPVGLSGNAADLSAVKDVAEKISVGLKKGDLVCLQTTVPPGTTEEILLLALEKGSGLVAGRDFGLIYSPERIAEGRAILDMEESYSAIVAGIGPKSLAAGVALYSIIARKGVIRMSSVRAAETEKVFEGVYRDVNIALANELAKICEGLGVDYWEVRGAANSQPYSHLHKPGVGVGGACIPVYPHFILEAGAKLKISTDMVRLAREVNSLMPKYCVWEALSLLARNGKSPAGCRVAVLGLAFRGGVSDTRLSPSYDVVRELLDAGCNVTVHDPYVSSDTKLPGSVVLTTKMDEALDGPDLVVIATDHKQYRKLNLKKLGRTIVYDGRGVLDGSRFSGMLFAGIGKAKKS